MRLNYIANAIGLAMIYIGVFLLIPICIALYYGEYSSIIPFLSAAIISTLSGFIIKKYIPKSAQSDNLNDIKKSEALFIVAFSWIIFSFA